MKRSKIKSKIKYKKATEVRREKEGTEGKKKEGKKKEGRKEGRDEESQKTVA